MQEIIQFVVENKDEILIAISVIFFLSLAIRILQRIRSRNQQAEYEQSLQQISIEHNLPSNQVIKNKFFTHFFKFIGLTVIFIITIFLLYYLSEQIWPVETKIE